MTLEFEHLPSSTKVKFVASLESFDDNYESSWSSESVVGRMDPLETFEGTKRVISFGWTVPSDGIQEAKENIEKAETLLRMLYPSYEQSENQAGSASRMNAAPLFRVKFANLISNPDGGGLVGRVNGFKYAPDLESGFFGASKGIIYPQTIEFSCQLNVFHTHSLGWNGKDFRQPNFPYRVGTAEDLQMAKRDEEIAALSQQSTSSDDAMVSLTEQKQTQSILEG